MISGYIRKFSSSAEFNLLGLFDYLSSLALELPRTPGLPHLQLPIRIKSFCSEIFWLVKKFTLLDVAELHEFSGYLFK